MAMDYAGAAGPRNGLTDVEGIRVGHARLRGSGALTGTTVVLGPAPGAAVAVEVRGGAPGTRDLDAVDPRNLAGGNVHAIVLTGGSAYGLAAADGAMAWLEEQGRGIPVAGRTVVPVVPAAVIFDLGRGGDPAARPGPELGREAIIAAAAQPLHAPVGQGSVGAGTGATAGGLRGGIGTASVRLTDGVTVAALVVLNAAGSAVDPRTGLPYGLVAGVPPNDPELLVGARIPEPGEPAPEFDLRLPAPEARRAARRELRRAVESRAAGSAPSPLNTTIGVIATDAVLTRPQAQKLADVGHDGIARGVRPAHSMLDGDTVFAMATGGVPLPGTEPGEQIEAFNHLLAAGADAFTRAMVHALLGADSTVTAWGRIPAYRELYPTAFPEVRP